jgi:hypothetical protein
MTLVVSRTADLLVEAHRSINDVFDSNKNLAVFDECTYYNRLQ